MRFRLLSLSLAFVALSLYASDVRHKTPSSGIMGKVPSAGSLKQVVGSVGFTPASITGIQSWLRSDVGVLNASAEAATDGQNVATWADQSGNGNDLTQAVDAFRPHLDGDEVNSLPAVNFSGSVDYMSVASLGLEQPLHYFYVLKIRSAVSNRHLYAGTAGNTHGSAIMSGGGGNVNLNAGTAGALKDYNASAYRIGSAYFDGASSYHSLDGDTAATGNIGTNDPDGISLGCTSDQTACAQVNFAEFIIYNAEITGDDLTNIMEYLSEKYAITLL